MFLACILGLVISLFIAMIACAEYADTAATVAAVCFCVFAVGVIIFGGCLIGTQHDFFSRDSYTKINGYEIKKIVTRPDYGFATALRAPITIETTYQMKVNGKWIDVAESDLQKAVGL